MYFDSIRRRTPTRPRLISRSHKAFLNVPVEPGNGLGSDWLAVPVLEDAPVASRVDDLVGWVQHNGGEVWEQAQLDSTEAGLQVADQIVEVNAVSSHCSVHLVANDAMASSGRIKMSKCQNNANIQDGCHGTQHGQSQAK